MKEEKNKTVERMKEIEINAKAIRERAEKKQEEIIQKARETSADTLALAKQKLKKEQEEAIIKEKKLIDRNAEKIIEKGLKDVEGLMKHAEENMGKAVDYIIMQLDKLIREL